LARWVQKQSLAGHALVIGRHWLVMPVALGRQSLLGSTAAVRGEKAPFFRTRLSEFPLSRGHRL